MTVDKLTSVEELDNRIAHCTQVRLLWSRTDNRLWVSVLQTRSGLRFTFAVEDGERPLDVFNHPFAYAAYHGVDTDGALLRLDPVEVSV